MISLAAVNSELIFPGPLSEGDSVNFAVPFPILYRADIFAGMPWSPFSGDFGHFHSEPPSWLFGISSGSILIPSSPSHPSASFA